MELMRIMNDQEMRDLGAKISAALRGGEIIELIGDVGAGKTTFVKGLAQGLAVDDEVQSPSFTINRRYDCRDGLSLSHYDFYRLSDAGIMNMELAESLSDPRTVTVIEWGQSVKDVLPSRRVVIEIDYLASDGREVRISVPESADYLSDIID